MNTYPQPMTDAYIEALIAAAPFDAGASREAFRVPTDPTVVVKRAKNLPMTNFTEWRIWGWIEGTSLEPSFGRCLAISETGRYLVMETLEDTDPVAHKKESFPSVPAWMSDAKRSAFGVDASGVVKIRDYGNIKLGPTLEKAARVPVAF